MTCLFVFLQICSNNTLTSTDYCVTGQYWSNILMEPKRSTHRERWPASEWLSSPAHACSWSAGCWCVNEESAAAACAFVHWTAPSPRSPASQGHDAVAAVCRFLLLPPLLFRCPPPPPRLAPAPAPALYGHRRRGSCCRSSVCPLAAALSSPPGLSLAACATGNRRAGQAWRERRAQHPAARGYKTCDLLYEVVFGLVGRLPSSKCNRRQMYSIKSRECEDQTDI